MPIRGVLTTLLIGCALVAAGVGVYVVKDANAAIDELKALICLLIVAVCAGTGLVVHAIDEQTIDGE